MDNFKGIEHFKSWEFDSRDLPGSGRNMQRSFLLALDSTRKDCGFKFVITSGFRTASHNSSVGGASNSSHLRGFAADIYAPTYAAKTAIIKHAIRNGMTGIGVMKSGIHLDNDLSIHPSVTFWKYKDTNLIEYHRLLAEHSGKIGTDFFVDSENFEGFEAGKINKLAYVAIAMVVGLITILS